MTGEIIPFYALRVRDMTRGNVELIGYCYLCPRYGIIEQRDVLKFFTPLDFVERIVPHLRCWRCGCRGRLIRRTLHPEDHFYRKPKGDGDGPEAA